MRVGPGDQPHRDEQPVVALARLVNGDDVLVVEPGLDLPFTLEAGAESGVVAQVRGEQLERDDAVQRELRGLVDGAHAPLSEYAVDAIPGNDRAVL